MVGTASGASEAFVRGDVREPADARGPVRAPLRLVEALSKLS
jgi:hypothetical protein